LQEKFFYGLQQIMNLVQWNEGVIEVGFQEGVIRINTLDRSNEMILSN